MVPVNWFLYLGSAVFIIGAFGLIMRKNVIIIFLSIELMLNAVNINLVALSYYMDDLRGQVLAVFVVALAAAEAAIGLAIIISVFRNRPTVDVDEFKQLKG